MKFEILWDCVIFFSLKMFGYLELLEDWKFFKNIDFIIYYIVFYNMNNVVINLLRD